LELYHRLRLPSAATAFCFHEGLKAKNLPDALEQDIPHPYHWQSDRFEICEEGGESGHGEQFGLLLCHPIIWFSNSNGRPKK
jgi:hypothetical protein